MDSAASRASYDPTRSIFVGNLPFTVDVRPLSLLHRTCRKQQHV